MAAKRFEKKQPDKKEIQKEEKKVNIGKAIGAGLLTLGGLVIAVITKGKHGGSFKT